MMKTLLNTLILALAMMFSNCTQTNDKTNRIGKHEVLSTKVGTVVSVVDGDTFQFLDSNSSDSKIRIVRLEAIDAPELRQPFGAKSKEKLQELILNKKVTLQILQLDRNKRLIARVFLDTLDVNRYLVSNGFAWHFSKFNKDPNFINDQRFAIRNRLNLWQDSNAVEPGEYRKNAIKF
jgi:micrococcal nuclease